MRKTALLLSCLLLAGCTDADWSDTLTGLGLDDAPAPQQVAMPAPPPPGPLEQRPENPDGFCQAVAHQDADGNDFDAPTRQRVFQARLAQCQAMFAGPPQPVASVPRGSETR